MRTKRQVKDLKSQLADSLFVSKDQLEVKLKKLMKDSYGNHFYERRLNRILDIIYEGGFVTGKAPKILGSADFYQKIEAFMNYDKEIFGEREIFTLIEQVYKSMYIVFILSFLDDAPFNVPYLGAIHATSKEIYSELLKKKCHGVYLGFKALPEVKEDLKKLSLGEKIDIIDEVLLDTEEVLAKKID
jgi:hypothetical protein